MPEERRTEVKERPALRLSFSQLVAASFATVSGAIAASFLGVYGTIIGTGVMSVVSTAGAVVYQHYLDRTRERLRSSRIASLTGIRAARAEELRREPADRAQDTVAPGGEADATQSGRPDSANHGEQEVEHRAGEGGAASGRGVRRRWRAAAGTAGAAALVFGFAMGAISTMEAFAGKPAASIVTGQAGTGTTFGRTVGTGPSGSNRVAPADTPGTDTSSPPPAPSPAPTSAPGQTAAPSPAPTPTSVPTEESEPATGTEDSQPDGSLEDRDAPTTP